jgi:hypothetical protein
MPEGSGMGKRQSDLPNFLSAVGVWTRILPKRTDTSMIDIEDGMPTSGNPKHRRCRSRGVGRLFLIALILVGSGCRSVSHPGVLVEHQPGEGSKTCPVPYTATYVLSAVDLTRGELIPLEHAKIEEKSQVGFVRQLDGEFIAYAGGRKFPLSEGHYVWQITPESQKTHGELRQAEAGKVLVATGKVLAGAGVVVLTVAGSFLILFLKAGGP